MSRVQLALNVSDLEASVAFYSTMFGVEPHKRRPGYANFAIENPPLKLVLIEVAESDRGTGVTGALNHLGVEVENTDLVQRAIGQCREHGECAARGAGARERQQAFEHEQEPAGGREVGPVDRHTGPQRPDCLRYLKNSPSGEITSTSFGWPSAWSIPANLLAVPVAGLVMLFGLPAVVLAGVLPESLARLLCWPVAIGGRWVSGVARVFAALPSTKMIDGVVDLVLLVVVIGAVGIRLTSHPYGNLPAWESSSSMAPTKSSSRPGPRARSPRSSASSASTSSTATTCVPC